MVLSALPPAQPVAKDINVSVKDCISRQAALDALEKIDCSDGVGISSLKCDAVNDAVTAIKALPSAHPGWIPCSESPMKNNSYLVWMPFAPEGHHITVAEWCGSYWNIKTPITAWMPLPNPYRPEGEEHG